MSEIKGLKDEIQQLKAEKAKTAVNSASQEPAEAIEQGKVQATKPKPQKETRKTAISTDIINKAPIPALITAEKPTYAGILRKEPTPQAHRPSNAPWTLVQKKVKPQVQDLAPKRATEPS
jgi:hypothetical protein